MAKSDTKPEALDVDAILNRARVNLARSQRLVEGWLPRSSNEQENNEEADASQGQDDIFIRPERAGLGADLSRLSSRSTGAIASPAGTGGELEKLRKQLMGRKAANSMNTQARADNYRKGSGSVPGPKRRRDASPDSDNDEEGRTASFKSKKSKITASDPQEIPHDTTDDLEQGESRDQVEEMSEGDAQNHAPKKKKPDQAHSGSSGSFLDQMLAERSKKKKKKRNT